MSGMLSEEGVDTAGRRLEAEGAAEPANQAPHAAARSCFALCAPLGADDAGAVGWMRVVSVLALAQGSFRKPGISAAAGISSYRGCCDDAGHPGMSASVARAPTLAAGEEPVQACPSSNRYEGSAVAQYCARKVQSVVRMESCVNE